MIYLDLVVAVVGSVARLSSSSLWTIAADEIQIEFLARKWLPVIPFEKQQKLTCLQTNRPDVPTTVYEGLFKGEQAEVQTTVYEGLLKGEQADVYTYRSSINLGTNSLNVPALY